MGNAKRVKLMIQHNPGDPSEVLSYVARVRRDLWAHSPVEIDPDDEAYATRRDANRNAFFEFVTTMPDEVQRVLSEFGHEQRVKMEVSEEPPGEKCLKCGRISQPVLPAVCPHCNHRDVEPCPHCRSDVPRQEYVPNTEGMFQCPKCSRYVQLVLNPDLWTADGILNQPVVLVEDAEAIGAGHK